MEEFITTQKFIRTTPRKLRLVADMVKKLKPQEAVAILPHVRKRAAGPLAKALMVVIANAKQKGFSDDQLAIKEIQIGEGPMLKRGRPVSRGRWHPYKKRMSHIRIVLTAKSEEPKPKSKTAKKEKKTTESKITKVQKSKGKEKKS